MPSKCMTHIKVQVMKRVRTIFIIRRAFTPFVFLVGATGVVLSTVSVSNVISNMPVMYDITAVAKFFAVAFAHTDVIVKCALVAGLVLLLLVLKGLIESIRLTSERPETL